MNFETQRRKDAKETGNQPFALSQFSILNSQFSIQ